MERRKELKESTLGKNAKETFRKPNAKILETFQNRYQKRDYVINIKILEFTSICPVTSQPDFATVYIMYIPDEKCIESKSLKLYIHSYRNFGIFYEDSINRILDDFVKTCEPKWIRVIGEFNPRGGISISPIVEYKKEGYKLPEYAKSNNK